MSVDAFGGCDVAREAGVCGCLLLGALPLLFRTLHCVTRFPCDPGFGLRIMAFVPA